MSTEEQVITHLLFKHGPPVARSLLLNVDLVTQLDPHMVDSLGQLVQDCDACAAKMDHGDENHQYTDVDDLS